MFIIYKALSQVGRLFCVDVDVLCGAHWDRGRCCTMEHVPMCPIWLNEFSLWLSEQRSRLFFVRRGFHLPISWTSVSISQSSMQPIKLKEEGTKAHHYFLWCPYKNTIRDGIFKKMSSNEIKTENITLKTKHTNYTKKTSKKTDIKKSTCLQNQVKMRASGWGITQETLLFR